MTNLLYEPYRRHCPEKGRQNCVLAFLHVSRAYITRCICLKLFTHWPEAIVKIEAYHPYRQSVVIIFSIVMMMRLLWLPFNDRYWKIICIMG